jgi:hypothetical protein
VVNIKIDSLLCDLGIVIKRDLRIVCTLGEGQNIVSLDLPDRDPEEIGEDKR